MSSGILLFEPKTDPEVERALERPGYPLSRATTLDEALRLIASHGFRLVVLNIRGWPLDRLRALAELWQGAKGQVHPPQMILVDNDLADWNVSRFGPVRFSDRRRLPEVCREALETLDREPTPDLADEAVWKTAVGHVAAKGHERFRAERERMRELGILDERGVPTSAEWPADMKPGSATDVAT